MKKIVLIAFSLFAIIPAKDSLAQSFSFPKDTVRYAVQGYNGEDIKNDIKNESSAPIQLYWKVTSHNLPLSWQSTFGLCDNVLCYSDAILSGTTQTMNTIAAGATSDFKVSMNFKDAEKGEYYVTAAITDSSSTPVLTKEMTFWIQKFPAGITTVRSSDGISLYPNPAQDELNVLFSSAAGIKNITVYNLIGKAMTVYKVTGNNSAKLNIQNIPAGIYFIRLSDAQGRVVATRKFTRQ